MLCHAGGLWGGEGGLGWGVPTRGDGPLSRAGAAGSQGEQRCAEPRAGTAPGPAPLAFPAINPDFILRPLLPPARRGVRGFQPRQVRGGGPGLAEKPVGTSQQLSHGTAGPGPTGRSPRGRLKSPGRRRGTGLTPPPNGLTWPNRSPFGREMVCSSPRPLAGRCASAPCRRGGPAHAPSRLRSGPRHSPVPRPTNTANTFIHSAQRPHGQRGHIPAHPGVPTNGGHIPAPPHSPFTAAEAEPPPPPDTHRSSPDTPRGA